MSWLRKAIGTPKQASKVLGDARKDVARPRRDELADRRQQKNPPKGGRR